MINLPVCEKCGNPQLIKFGDKTICLENRLHDYLKSVDNTFQLGYYYKKSSINRKRENDLLNDHIWNANNDPRYTKPLADALFLLMKNRYTQLLNMDIIIPVPNYQLKDNYTNSEGIAQELQNNFDDGGITLRVVNCLENIKDVKLQYLNKIERDDAIEEMFTYNNKINISGKNVILLDYILTAGQVIGTCAKLLKDNGASKVCVLVLGRVV